MNDAILFDEILKLTWHCPAGKTSEEERARLERMLSESKQAVVYYLKIVDDALTIRESAETRAAALLDPNVNTDFADEQDDTPRSRRASRVSWPVIAIYLAAACLAVITAGLFFVPSPGMGNRLASQSANIARVVNTSGVEWSSNAKQFHPWTPIAPGDTIRIQHGAINLFISNGVELLIEGPADVRFASLERVIVAKGKLAARVGPDAIGFSIETPHANVIDRGTSFGISVDNKLQTDIVVYEGIVDLDVVGHGNQPRRRLLTGEALRVNNHGDLSRIASVQGAGFVSLPQATTAPSRHVSVIESVTDNIRLLETAKFNRVIPGGFDEDCRAYVDREHEWNGMGESGLPTCLLGGDYVMTFNEDKTATDFELDVVLAEPANLYVLVDNRVPPPDWLVRDFVDTKLEVGLDEVHRHVHLEAARGAGKSLDQIYSVWHRVVREASTVVLGPLGRDEFSVPARVVKRGMYGIVATPLDNYRDN